MRKCNHRGHDLYVPQLRISSIDARSRHSYCIECAALLVTFSSTPLRPANTSEHHGRARRETSSYCCITREPIVCEVQREAYGPQRVSSGPKHVYLSQVGVPAVLVVGQNGQLDAERLQIVTCRQKLSDQLRTDRDRIVE